MLETIINAGVEIIKYSVPSILAILVTWMTTKEASERGIKYEKEKYKITERKDIYLEAYILIDKMVNDNELITDNDYYNEICALKPKLYFASTREVYDAFNECAHYIFENDKKSFEHDIYKKMTIKVLKFMKADIDLQN